VLVLVDLVQTTTRDDLRLDGSFQPAPSSPSVVGLDGVCMVHGTGGNFYSSTLFDALAERFLSLGVSVLRVNTRGHDGISSASTPRGGRRQGAAYEVIDDCRHDLAAWAGWLKGRAGPRVGLLGHSMGAVKCLYALAQEPAIGAACAVAVSPPRLSYATFVASPQGKVFRDDLARAEALVAAGEPAALMEVRLPLPLIITAAGFLEKYGPEERYNYFRFLPGVPCPTLFAFGGHEVAGHVAFQGAPAELEARKGRQAVEVVTIPEADHFYTDGRDALAGQIEACLRRALPAAGAQS
jgi:dienelactone hydrolase